MDADVEKMIETFRSSSPDEVIRLAYLQGELFQFINRGPKKHFCHSVKDRKIKGFTYQARLRLLKFKATIAFETISNSFFCTFTYPDVCLPRSREQLNMDRSVLLRGIEKACGKKLCGLWRKEWVPRLSGPALGDYAPHWHVLLFSIGFIPYRKIRKVWNDQLKYDGEASMKFLKCREGSKAASYVSKYIGKESPCINLDNVLQLNNCGRHYGYHRKGLIPRVKRVWAPVLSREQAFIVWQEIRRMLPWIDEPEPMSFALIGRLSERIVELYKYLSLTGGREIVDSE